MTQHLVVTVAGKQYANAASYIRSMLGTLRSRTLSQGAGPVPVTIRSDDQLDEVEIRALI